MISDFTASHVLLPGAISDERPCRLA
uniref:Uncharacterized protein n=1 Tax=Arundo donax TaxID=35708 RepID=A0A0A9HLN9_ARUDO